MPLPPCKSPLWSTLCGQVGDDQEVVQAVFTLLLPIVGWALWPSFCSSSRGWGEGDNCP